MDLVSYNHKHNEANGENNRDGTDHNLSWNCGQEGEATLSEVILRRKKLRRALLATLLFSQGTPMLVAAMNSVIHNRGITIRIAMTVS